MLRCLQWVGCGCRRCARHFHCGVVPGAVAGVVGQVESGGGGPQVASNRAVNPLAQGQVAGRCRCRRRAVVTTRAAAWIRRRRMVAVVALARPAPAMLAAARVRLNAIVARVVQAALAVNTPGAGAPGARSSGRR